MNNTVLLRTVLCFMLLAAPALLAGCATIPPGHDPRGPGNSENAPGHDPSGPGNSENAHGPSPYLWQ